VGGGCLKSGDFAKCMCGVCVCVTERVVCVCVFGGVWWVCLAYVCLCYTCVWCMNVCVFVGGVCAWCMCV